MIKFGLEIDTIFPNPETIEENWKNVIDSILTNKEIYIRGYGRDAHGTKMFQELYKILLKNENVLKDPTNNAKPTQILQEITFFSKTIKKDNGVAEKISNYQVTHIFARTKNPFLFTAPWNLVWKPKILDPFTGHESRGENTNLYKTAFFNKAKKLYSKFILEYNALANEYFSEQKLLTAFGELEKRLSVDKSKLKKFEVDARKELTIIS